MSNSTSLSDEQLALLAESKRLRDNGKEPVVLSESAVTSAKEVLGSILEENHGLRDGSSLPLDALAAQLSADLEEEVVEIDQLSQQPVTGIASADGLENTDSEPADETEIVESLSHDERRQVAHLVDKAGHLSSRLPNHSARLRDDAADIAGLEDNSSISVSDVRSALADVGLDTDHSKLPPGR